MLTEVIEIKYFDFATDAESDETQRHIYRHGTTAIIHLGPEDLGNGVTIPETWLVCKRGRFVGLGRDPGHAERMLKER